MAILVITMLRVAMGGLEVGDGHDVQISAHVQTRTDQTSPATPSRAQPFPDQDGPVESSESTCPDFAKTVCGPQPCSRVGKGFARFFETTRWTCVVPNAEEAKKFVKTNAGIRNRCTIVESTKLECYRYQYSPAEAKERLLKTLTKKGLPTFSSTGSFQTQISETMGAHHFESKRFGPDTVWMALHWDIPTTLSRGPFTTQRFNFITAKYRFLSTKDPRKIMEKIPTAMGNKVKLYGLVKEANYIPRSLNYDPNDVNVDKIADDLCNVFHEVKLFVKPSQGQNGWGQLPSFKWYDPNCGSADESNVCGTCQLGAQYLKRHFEKWSSLFPDEMQVQLQIPSVGVNKVGRFPEISERVGNSYLRTFGISVRDDERGVVEAWAFRPMRLCAVVKKSKGTIACFRKIPEDFEISPSHDKERTHRIFDTEDQKGVWFWMAGGLQLDGFVFPNHDETYLPEGARYDDIYPKVREVIADAIKKTKDDESMVCPYKTVRCFHIWAFDMIATPPSEQVNPNLNSVYLLEANYDAGEFRDLMPGAMKFAMTEDIVENIVLQQPTLRKLMQEKNLIKEARVPKVIEKIEEYELLR